MTDLSSEALALLATIRDNHADDTPRLIFADYLDERGEAARAEFVRVQVELAVRGNHDVSTRGLGLKQCCGCGSQQIYERCIELRDRERELLQMPVSPGRWTPNWVEWFRNMKAGPANVVTMAGIHAVTNAANEIVLESSRGFLSHVVCSWEDWSRHGDAILADPWVPGLDEVELTTWPMAVPDHLDGIAMRVRLQGRRATVKIADELVMEMTWEQMAPSVYRRLLELEWPKDLVRSWKLPPERSHASRWAGRDGR